MTYPIPDEALDDRLAITGTSGAGKTYAALGAVARLMARGSRVIAVDPLGVMYGLRLKPDGFTPSGLKPVIFGGPHGDLPLSVGAATLIGETAATMAESCILDLSELGTKAAERRFMLGFLTALYRKANKDPVHLVIDEADMFAPQKMDDKEGEAAKLMGMMETIVRRGRVKGFIPWLITQRPAVLNKNVLSQADGVIAMKLTSSQDRDAIGGWIEGQADRAKGKEILGLLPTMDRGAGVVWIPGRSILKTAQFPENRTFDSSRTPHRGEVRRAVDLKPLDLGKLKDRLATVEQEAKANDPSALKAKVAQLTGELAQARKGVPAAPSPAGPTKADLVAADARVEAARADAAQTILVQVAAALDHQHSFSFKAGIAAGLLYLVDKAKTIAADPAVLVPIPDRKPLAKGLMPAWTGKPMPTSIMASPAIQKALREETRVSALQPGGPIPVTRPGAKLLADGFQGPQRRVLEAVGFWKSVGQSSPTREQVAGLAGYAPTTGNYRAVVGSLNTAGLLSIPAKGKLRLGDGAPVFSLTMGEARDRLLSVMDGPQKKVLNAALESPGPITREALAAGSDYEPTTGNFRAVVGSLCTLDVLTKPSKGEIAVSDWARQVLA